MKIPIVIMLMFSTLFSAQTVHGKYNQSCYKYELAVEVAPRPSRTVIKEALGCKKFEYKDKAADNCKPCSNEPGKYTCQGVVTAYCVSDEPKEQERKKEVKPKETEPKKLSQEEWEKAEIARVIKEEQERIEAKERIEKLLKDAEKEVADEYEKLMAAELNQNVQRIVNAQDALRKKERKDAEIANKKAQKKKAKKAKNKVANRKKSKKSSTSKDVFVDSTTGLMWQDNKAIKNKNNVMNQPNAGRYCKSLTLAGYSDWNLPTLKQLKGLVKKKNKLKFNSRKYLWSSTNCHDKTMDEGPEAWTLALINGKSNGWPVLGTNAVRCVRGGK